MALLCMIVSSAALFGLPALVLAVSLRIRKPYQDSLDLLVTILGFAAFLVPAVGFLFAALTLETVGWWTVAGTAVAILALTHQSILTQGRIVRKWGRRALILDETGRWERAAILLAGLVFVYQFIFFDGPMGFHFGCMYRPCAFAAGLVDLGEFDGLNTSLLYNDHQRMGVTAILTPFLALYGLAGLRLFWGFSFALVPLAVYGIYRHFDRGGPVAFASAALASVLPAVGGVQDQNRLLLAITCFAIYLAVRSRHRPFYLGLILALAWAAEPALIVTAWIVPLLIARSQGPRLGPVRYAARLAFGFLIMALPFVLRLLMMSGIGLHEHFSYIPPQTYSLFGRSFTIHAFLNWPFYDAVVRSPFNPLPNLALVPLNVMQHFGLLALGLVACSLPALVAKRRILLLIALWGFFLSVAALLAVNENWTQRNKWDIVTMAYGPLFICFGFGLRWLIAERARTLRRLTVYLGIIVALTAFHALLRQTHGEYDARFAEEWGERYQPISPEITEYMALEHSRLRAVPVLPNLGQSVHPTAEHLRFAVHDLTHKDVLQRLVSMSEAFLFEFFGSSGPIASLKPTRLADPRRMDKSNERPVRFRLDLRISPSSGISSANRWSVEREPCTDPPIHLHPGFGMKKINVSWNPWPILIGTILDDSGRAGLIIIRSPTPEGLYLETEPIPAGCMAVHLPNDRPMVLADLVSFDPSLVYTYEIMTPEGPTGPVRLRLVK